MGAFVFMALEGGFYKSIDAVAESKVDPSKKIIGKSTKKEVVIEHFTILFIYFRGFKDTNRRSFMEYYRKLEHTL